MNVKHLVTANKIHALVNLKGSTARAGLSDGDFHEEDYRVEVDGVPFSRHRGFDSCIEAMAWLQKNYPHITCQADIIGMNNNAPLEASNLTPLTPPYPRYQ